jgi:hypothetical protein
MNQEEKAKYYDWLLSKHRDIQQKIKMVPKLPLEQTLQDINSREYSRDNQNKVDALNLSLQRIDEEVKRLF